MKQRFSSLDVKVIAHELSQTLVPLRVTNIYDLSSRIFLFKFHRPDHREQLIVESGFRCHLTSYARTTASAPSGFVARLRKYLKTRRVTSIAQVGTDRIIEFVFSDGLYKLYFEFYAGGNIVLTDGSLKVLALLRNVDEGAEHERLRVGLEYNLSLRQNYQGIPDLTEQRLREALQKAVVKQHEAAPDAKKSKKQSKDALRKAIAISITECPPLLVDHALNVAKFDSTLTPDKVLADDSLLTKLLAALKHARNTFETITDADPIKGYILAKPNLTASSADGELSDKSLLLYDDFHPFRPAQFEIPGYTFTEFDGFNKAVDEFFSSIEGQKLESKLHERELAAKKKLHHARQEHSNRIGGLQQVQELNFQKAEAIAANIHRVSETMDAVNGLIGQGMDWGEIARLIEREQAQGNPVAELIKLPLRLHENTITLLLDASNAGQAKEDEDELYESSSVSDNSDDEDDHPGPAKDATKAPQISSDQRLAIDIDLGLTAWANSTEYFDQKKQAATKEERTVQASERALKNHERKVAEDLKKGLKQEKEVLRPVRKQQWFEKYIYFISSDGYLVLGGKDIQQNEILYRRYLRKGDIYVHADLKGASPMIIKNNPQTTDAPIPPSTLSQAGHLSISTSEAWDLKAVMSAWWVTSEQVSKTGQTGEYLAPGLFNIKGRKEYLPPAQLMVGLAVMFEINEESKARHLKHRYVDALAPTSVEAPRETAQDGSQDPAMITQEASDSDEDFPDAKIVSDSEDDFPDAKIEEESEDSDGEVESANRSNPLQSSNTALADQSNPESDAEEKEPAAAAPQSTRLDDKPPGEPQGFDILTAKPASTTAKLTKRHLSARERRLLRKGHLPDDPPSSPSVQPAIDAAEDNDDSNTPTHPLSSVKSIGDSTSQASKIPNSSPLPRGKRSKAKKLAAKYANQDEEERELAMRLLGSQTGQKAAEAEAEIKRAKEAEVQANKQRRRDQHLHAQTIGKAAEQARQAAHQEDDLGNDQDDETTKTQLLSLDAFTGRPLPGDKLISAIPICAPWSALASYKYKVKLQPGTLKRGKAVKDILSRWDAAGKNPKATDKFSKDPERIWPAEIELIRQWKEAEVVGALPVGKVKIMMAGGTSGGATKGKIKANRGGRGSKKK